MRGAGPRAAPKRSAVVLQVLKARGMEVSAGLPRHLQEMKGISTAALVQAAMQCRDEAEFLHLARAAHGQMKQVRRQLERQDTGADLLQGAQPGS